jgi:hypothetical protein
LFNIDSAARSKYHQFQMPISQVCRWLCIAAGALAATDAARARGEFCGTLPAAGFDQPPHGSHSGLYVNPVYGYAVVIPKRLIAYASSGVAERGFGMLLSWAPRAYLQVDAAYDAYYDISADGVHRRDLNAIRLHDRVVSDQASAYLLAHVGGDRYVTWVQCAGEPQIYIHDDVIVMRNREIYRLNLQSVPERYASDIKLFDAMLRTWRWRPIAKPYVKQ